MNKKTLALAVGALTLGVSGQASADNPFQTIDIKQAYNAKGQRIKLAAQVCGGKNSDAACNAASIKSSDCSDADYKEFQAFKASKYFKDYQNSDAYKAFKADQKNSTPAMPATKPETKTKSSSCSAGGCGG